MEEATYWILFSYLILAKWFINPLPLSLASIWLGTSSKRFSRSSLKTCVWVCCRSGSIICRIHSFIHFLPELAPNILGHGADIYCLLKNSLSATLFQKLVSFWQTAVQHKSHTSVAFNAIVTVKMKLFGIALLTLTSWYFMSKFGRRLCSSCK